MYDFPAAKLTIIIDIENIFGYGGYNDRTLDAVENKRKNVVHLLEFPDAGFAYHDNGHRLSRFCLVLRHHLTAGSAWSCRLLGKAPVDSTGEGYAAHIFVREFGAG